MDPWFGHQESIHLRSLASRRMDPVVVSVAILLALTIVMIDAIGSWIIGPADALLNGVAPDKHFDLVPNGEIVSLLLTIKLMFEGILLNESCKFDEECKRDHSLCEPSTKKCACKPSYIMRKYPDFGINCVNEAGNAGPKVDPAVIGAVVGLGLMFVIICVVLRMFSKERFRENRSIFNTPNPRLMNASLFKDSKLLSPARGERRGSRASVRGPSRASSIVSVNKEGTGKSPNGSIVKGRRGSALSTISATGSASGALGTAPPKISSPIAQDPKETSVAIETVD